MTPDKVKTVNGHKVEQFYWAGKDVVYIDSKLAKADYSDITEETIDNILKN